MRALAFELPAALEAAAPPEARGLERDDVRLMVATRGDGAIAHARFHELSDHLAPGDLLVVNTSATVPAAIAAQRDDALALELRVSTAAPRLPGGWWVIELRRAEDGAPFLDADAGDRLTLLGGVHVELIAPYGDGTRLWLARVAAGVSLRDHLDRHGHPIRYGHVAAEWPLSAYQTVFATELGSAEMPSAGRPFTAELVTHLVSNGVLVAPLRLHTGVSSPEAHEAPYPEPFAVPVATARMVNVVHAWGGRVVAVGTTVVRALESVASADGSVEPGEGWTDLVVTPQRGLLTVDGLLTGWHEPEASHLRLLEAAAGAGLLHRSYRAALDEGYLWHEFGDSHLILP